MGVELGLLH